MNKPTHFIMLLEATDEDKIKKTLLDFKEKLKENSEMTVFKMEEDFYNFLYNILMEHRNNE